MSNQQVSLASSLQNLAIPAVLVYFIVFIYKHRTKHLLHDAGRKSPPRAKLGPLQCIKMLASKDYPFLIINEAKKLQSYVFQLNMASLFFVPAVLVVGEPKIVKEIFIDPLSTKPKQMYGAMEGTFDGYANMFTSNGQFWHSRRKGMSPAFASKHIKRMNLVATQKVDQWIETKLSSFIKNDEAFDVAKEMINVVFDAIIETAFEYNLSDKEKEDFCHELKLSLLEFVPNASNPFRKAFGMFIAERRRAHLAARRVREFSLKLIDVYRQSKNPTKDTIIDRIMNNDAYENDNQRASDITLLLIAGHDTTAFTISWILREMARHPKEQKELRESLKSVDREEWRQSDALKKVVKEGMRLFPVASGGSIRTLGRDFVTDGGLFLPKGSMAFIPLILLLRNSDIFEDADSFIPSRWDNPTNEMEAGFLPFALGKQNCIGQSLATAEIYSIVPRICAEFELELVDEGETNFFLTWKPVNVMLKAKRLS